MLDHGTNSVTEITEGSPSSSRAPSPQIERPDSPAPSFGQPRTTPKYTAEELGAMFLDFYKFMAKLHFDIKDLHIPPPGGWPYHLPARSRPYISDIAFEAIKHLPHFTSKASIHYKSVLSGGYPGFFEPPPPSPENDVAESTESESDDEETWETAEGEIVDSRHVVNIAYGHESGGREMQLNTLDGEMIEVEMRCDSSVSDVKDYLEGLMWRFETLRLVPCWRKVTIEAESVAEREEVITEEEVCAQTERWYTDLEVQYVRQLYRGFEWPENFRKEEAFRPIKKLMDRVASKSV